MTSIVGHATRIGDPAAAAVHLAKATFGTSLIAAFVGGSRAAGTHHERSDVDAFVVISASDRLREVEYALALRSIHHEYNLKFDHCGEIFDLATLNSLLSFTELIDTRAPNMGASPCYQGNCLLSIYRKGRVVMGFLAGPKINVSDRYGLIAALTERSRQHIDRHRTIAPHRSAHVTLPSGTRPARMVKVWASTDATSGLIDTPVGVELGRWFGEDLRAREIAIRRSSAPRVGPEHGSLVCPLAQCGCSDRDRTPRQHFAAQCLATNISNII